MDKISNPIRQGSVDLKEVVQNWEEELFANLIADKEGYLDHKNKDKFDDATFESYQVVEHKVTALCDAKIIDSTERDILINKFYEIMDEYKKSKIKEVKVS